MKDVSVEYRSRCSTGPDMPEESHTTFRLVHLSSDIEDTGNNQTEDFQKVVKQLGLTWS